MNFEGKLQDDLNVKLDRTIHELPQDQINQGHRKANKYHDASDIDHHLLKLQVSNISHFHEGLAWSHHLEEENLNIQEDQQSILDLLLI
jgi:hypothetical protein